MNWIKASTRRAKEEFLQTVGHHQGTVDAEFDAAELHYQQVFKDLQKVQETVQMWSDCMDTAFAASLGTGEVVARFFASLGNASSKVEMDSPARTYMAIQSDINEKLRKPMHRVLLERCLRPITELLAVAPVLNDKLSARKKALLDVDFYTSKYAGEAEQGREKNEPKMARLAAKLEAATKNLEEIENELIAAFEEIEVSKTQLLRSEISTFFACHFYLLQTSANMMSDLIGVSPYSAASLCALEAERSHESFLYKETIEQPRAVSASRNNERGDDAINALSSALRDTSPVARLKHARASTSAVRAANVAAATAAAAEPYEGKKSGSAGARLASVSGAISTGLRRLSMVSSNKGAAQPSMGASKPVKTIESQKSGTMHLHALHCRHTQCFSTNSPAMRIDVCAFAILLCYVDATHSNMIAHPSRYHILSHRPTL